MFGPWAISKLFSKPVSCVAHYFCEFCKEADHYFPCFWTNSSFNGASIFLTVMRSFYCFQGPSILTWGTLSHRSHMFQRFHLFLASLVMSQKNIRLEWFGRGNIDDIETTSYIQKQPSIWSLYVVLYIQKRPTTWSLYVIYSKAAHHMIIVLYVVFSKAAHPMNIVLHISKSGLP